MPQQQRFLAALRPFSARTAFCAGVCLISPAALAEEPDSSGEGAVPSVEPAREADGEGEAIEVVVEGAPLHPRTPPRDDTVAGSVVRRDRLEAPGLGAADALRRETGVEVVQYGGFGAPATASIRGATAAQTPVYLAGIRLNDEVGGSADLSQIPLWLIDRIEIYRGHAPLYADEFGIGGAVLFEPPRPRAGTSGAGLMGGSFGTASGFAWTAAGDERKSVLVGAELARAENDYPFPDDRGTLFVSGDDSVGTQQNADASLLDAWAVARFELGAARLDVIGNAAAREQGVPKLSLAPSQRARARYERALAGVRASGQFGSQGEHAFRLGSSFVSASSVYDDPARELGLAASRLEILGRRAAQRAELELELASGVELGVALDLSLDQLLRDDVGVSRTRGQQSGGRLAASLSLEAWDGWFVIPTGGVACRSGSAAEAPCGEPQPIGRITVARRGPWLTAFGSVGRYVRFPTLGELHGAGALVRGNPALTPERGDSAELGARAQAKIGALHLWLDLAGYLRRADRLVSYLRAAQGYLVPVNVAAARVVGLETALGGSLGQHFDADLSLTFSDPRNVTPERSTVNDVLPFHSRFVGAASVGLASAPHLPGQVDRSRARLSVLQRSSRFADPAGLIVIPEQRTFDLELSQGFAAESLLLRARVANLLDAARFDVVGYPLPGRSVFVSVEVVSR